MLRVGNWPRGEKAMLEYRLELTRSLKTLKATETNPKTILHSGKQMRLIIQSTILVMLLIAPANFFSQPLPQSAPNIGVNAALSAGQVGRGRTVQATVTMDIPAGFHVNSNRPLEKFLIPTQLKIDAPKGIRVSAVTYPRAVSRNFKFSKNRVSVYEGRATMRFSLTIPANFSTGTTEVKAHLRYQSCNDDVCFPPQNRDVSLWLKVQ